MSATPKLQAGKPATTFGQMVHAARRAKGWSAVRLGVEVGLRERELAMNENQVRRLENDDRAALPSRLVATVIQVLELDPEKARDAAYPEVAALTAVGGAGGGRSADQASGTNRNTSPFVVPIGRAA